VADCFIDTNILLYAISTDPAEAAKTAISRRLIQNNIWAWSAQVAAEFVRSSTSPKKPKPLTWQEASQWITVWRAFPLAHVDGDLVIEAIQIAERYMISYYDSQIVAAAKRMHCSTLFTEDLNHGQDYGGVIAVNPFRTAVGIP